MPTVMPSGRWHKAMQLVVLDMIIPCASNNLSPCIEGPMTNTPIKSGTILKSRPGAVMHTYIVEMNVESDGAARYLVKFIDEASGYQVRVI